MICNFQDSQIALVIFAFKLKLCVFLVVSNSKCSSVIKHEPHCILL